MKIVDESILFFSRVSLLKFSLEALNISWVYGVFILKWERNAKILVFSITEWTSDLASWLDWVASPSHEITEWPDWTFCPVMLQLAWWFSFSTCFTCVHLLAACKSWATREIQLWVPASLHSFKHFFTLSHTLPLHDSHLNTGLLIAKLQANLAWNKANKMVD